MNFVSLKMSTFNYQCTETNNAQLALLSTFLRTEITSNLFYDYYTDWLTGKYDQDFASGNAYGLKEYNNNIYVYSIFDDEAQQLTSFNTTKQKMLDILYDWAILVSQKQAPQQIMITEENNTITIKAINSQS